MSKFIEFGRNYEWHYVDKKVVSSVILEFYNEEDSYRPFFRVAMERNDKPAQYEIIFSELEAAKEFYNDLKKQIEGE